MVLCTDSRFVISIHFNFGPSVLLTPIKNGDWCPRQTPYFWPSNCWEPENTDYAVYLCKRTMQNKARLELADYEAENLARLQKMFSRKWEFIFMQAEAQSRVDKKRDKLERKVLDSQERAFWDVHRPVVRDFLHQLLRSRLTFSSTDSQRQFGCHSQTFIAAIR